MWIESDQLRVRLNSVGARVCEIDFSLGDVWVPVSLIAAGSLEQDPFSMGATCGRYANRLAGGTFWDGAQRWALERNEPNATLHGGPGGLGWCEWTCSASNGKSAEFLIESAHLDQGFPGNLQATTRYTLAAGTLRIEWKATTDRATPVSLTNHTYFQLDPAASTIDQHELSLPADRVLESTAEKPPTGKLLDLADTELDFRSLRPLGRTVLDHAFPMPGKGLRLAAILRSPASGVTMETWTTQPCVQVYTADFLAEPFVPRGAICIEAQAYPDAPNQPGFPSAVLEPDAVYRHAVEYRFTGS